MNKREVIEPCPKCGTLHKQQEFVLWNEAKDGEPVTVAAPPDIDCECGIAIRWAVPIISITNSGYVLRIRRDNESPRIKGENE